MKENGQADFLLFPDDGQRHELIDGEHHVIPSPNLSHHETSDRLHLLIGTLAAQRVTQVSGLEGLRAVAAPAARARLARCRALRIRLR